MERWRSHRRSLRSGGLNLGLTACERVVYSVCWFVLLPSSWCARLGGRGESRPSHLSRSPLPSHILNFCLAPAAVIESVIGLPRRPVRQGPGRPPDALQNGLRKLKLDERGERPSRRGERQRLSESLVDVVGRRKQCGQNGGLGEGRAGLMCLASPWRLARWVGRTRPI